MEREGQLEEHKSEGRSQRTPPATQQPSTSAPRRRVYRMLSVVDAVSPPVACVAHERNWSVGVTGCATGPRLTNTPTRIDFCEAVARSAQKSGGDPRGGRHEEPVNDGYILVRTWSPQLRSPNMAYRLKQTWYTTVATTKQVFGLTTVKEICDTDSGKL
jgi:hypothetical protein